MHPCWRGSTANSKNLVAGPRAGDVMRSPTWADTVEKVFSGWRTKFFRTPMRSARSDVRAHVDSRRSVHRPWYLPYETLKRRWQRKTDFARFSLSVFVVRKQSYFSIAGGFSLRSRSRIASSTRRSDRLASWSCASADCARNSNAVTLSSAATIRALASVKAIEASCNLRSASLMTSRRALSATSRRFSASCARSVALLQTDCARASVSRTCSSIARKSSAA